MKEQEPSVPIKKKPTFKRSPLIKYGSNFVDQGTGGSKIRTVYKDWDEQASSNGTSTGTTKQRTFKEFRALLEASKSAKGASKEEDRIEELLVIAYNATAHQSFREWLGTISKLINQI